MTAWSSARRTGRGLRRCAVRAARELVGSVLTRVATRLLKGIQTRARLGPSVSACASFAAPGGPPVRACLLTLVTRSQLVRAPCPRVPTRSADFPSSSLFSLCDEPVVSSGERVMGAGDWDQPRYVPLTCLLRSQASTGRTERISSSIYCFERSRLANS